jgi:uncharacterized membrane protein SpoIIM required for sporulation
MRNSLAYFIIGSLLGSGIASFLFMLDKNLIDVILSAWFKRMTFGLKYFNGDYKLWFITNNLVAILMIVVALLLIITMFLRKRKFHISYFRKYERENPKITLYSLYMIPIGALIINGALVSFFLTFIFLSQGIEKFSTALVLMMPHGVNEFIALILACSYGLAYIKLIKPLVLKRDWKGIVKMNKRVFYSQTTVIFIILIIIVVAFSGFIEGSLTALVK